MLTLLLRGLVFLPLVCSGLKVVDMTWAHSDDTVYWPGNPSYNFTVITRGQMHTYWYESNKFATAEHGGTHIDAPAHFFNGSWRMHEIPPERLVGPAVIIDVKSKVETNPDYRLMISDLNEYETEHDRIPEGAIVVMNSGWGFRYPNKSRVFNTEQPDKPSTFHFPGFHQDAVSWLVANRKVGMIGVDTPSIDYGQSIDFKVHVIAGENNVPGLENVAHIDKIPVSGATIVVGAIKLYDGSGGPARLLAIFDEDKTLGCKATSSSDQIDSSITTVLLSLFSSLYFGGVFKESCVNFVIKHLL